MNNKKLRNKRKKKAILVILFFGLKLISIFYYLKVRQVIVKIFLVRIKVVKYAKIDNSENKSILFSIYI